eukprot:gene31267-6411_t
MGWELKRLNLAESRGAAAQSGDRTQSVLSRRHYGGLARASATNAASPGPQNQGQKSEVQAAPSQNPKGKPAPKASSSAAHASVMLAKEKLKQSRLVAGGQPASKSKPQSQSLPKDPSQQQQQQQQQSSRAMEVSSSASDPKVTVVKGIGAAPLGASLRPSPDAMTKAFDPYVEASSQRTGRPFSRSKGSDITGGARQGERGYFRGDSPLQREFSGMGDETYVENLQRLAGQSGSSITKGVAQMFQSVIDGRGGTKQQGRTPQSSRAGGSGRDKETRLFKKAPSGPVLPSWLGGSTELQEKKKLEEFKLERFKSALAVQKMTSSIEDKYSALLDARPTSVDEIQLLHEKDKRTSRATQSLASTSMEPTRLEPTPVLGIVIQPLGRISTATKSAPDQAPPLNPVWDIKHQRKKKITILEPASVESETAESWKRSVRQAAGMSGRLKISSREVRRIQYRSKIMPKRAKMHGLAEGEGVDEHALRQQKQLTQLVLLNPKVYQVNLRHGYSDRMKRMAASVNCLLKQYYQGMCTAHDELEEDAAEGTETNPSSVHYPQVASAAKCLKEVLGIELPDKSFYGRRGQSLSELSDDFIRKQCQIWLKVAGEDYTKKFICKEPCLVSKDPTHVLQSLEVLNTVIMPESSASQCVDFALKNTTLIGYSAEQLDSSVQLIANIFDINPGAARRLALKNTTLNTTLIGYSADQLESSVQLIANIFGINPGASRRLALKNTTLLTVPTTTLEENCETLLQLFPVNPQNSIPLTVPTKTLEDNFETLLQLFPVTAERLRSILASRPKLLTPSPGLVGVALVRLESRWQLLLELSALTPAWQEQLQSAAPPTLGRMLKAPEKHIERLRLVAEAEMTRQKDAADLTKLLTMSDDYFYSSFKIAPVVEEPAPAPTHSDPEHVEATQEQPSANKQPVQAVQIHNFFQQDQGLMGRSATA